MAKDNDRARLEKTWEDAMGKLSMRMILLWTDPCFTQPMLIGEDWREFRARLVQQEHVEGEIDAMEKGRSKKDGEKIGNFITGAISSIFSKKDGKDDNESAEAPAKDIFDGEVGGAVSVLDYARFLAHCSDSFLCTDTHNPNDSVEVQQDPIYVLRSFHG